MSTPVTILWLRRDLRVSDHPALAHAAQRGRVVPVYILPDHDDDPWHLGGAARWWLHGALVDLGRTFQKLGAPLVLRRGDAQEILVSLVRETGADSVFFSRSYEPWARQRDELIVQALRAKGVAVQTFQSRLLFEPGALLNKSGGPYKVYTPYAKACLAAPSPEAPLPAPPRLSGVLGIASEALADWHLQPQAPNWAAEMQRFWPVGEKAARERLHDFVHNGLADYKTGRDRPDRDGTSRLSPYLSNGQISARQIWHVVNHALQHDRGAGPGALCFLHELLWREFAGDQLFHRPDLPVQPLQQAFAKFPWRRDDKALRAWQRGQTGYPIIDAGMRQLWQTGWMHNRVRMIVASFLVKDLLLPWQAGEAWFWDTLIDADLASNAASWQWVAGCGADAAPYFRVFNPVLQGQKFDPSGDYVRRFVPELAGLSGAVIHAPWLMEEKQLKAQGLVLGRDYPHPIVDHAAARTRALAALKTIKQP